MNTNRRFQNVKIFYPGTTLMFVFYLGTTLMFVFYPGTTLMFVFYPGTSLMFVFYSGTTLMFVFYPGTTLMFVFYPGTTLMFVFYPGTTLMFVFYPGTSLMFETTARMRIVLFQYSEKTWFLYWKMSCCRVGVVYIEILHLGGFFQLFHVPTKKQNNLFLILGIFDVLPL